MDESPEPSQNDDPSTSDPQPDVIAIAPKGDLVLDVTFETSKSTLKAARKATAPKKPPPRPGQAKSQVQAAQIRLAYRVDLATLKKHSRYFTNLLGDTRFSEARAVAASLADLSLRGEKPADVTDPKAWASLPRVRIIDDDEATRSPAAGRERALRDMLRILHGQSATTKPVTMLHVVTLAVLADRFACAAAVARYLATGLKFKWPATPPSRLREEDGLSGLGLAAEEVVRQKVLVSWLLDQPPRFSASTREMVIHGSHRWSMKDESEDEEDVTLDPARVAASSRQEALWWYLPDGLEEELHHRRQLILRTLASIPSHFLTLYSSRPRAGVPPQRQCKLGYDTSAACDSFQLGETVKFLVAKHLLFLTNFSPSSLDQIRDFAAVDAHSIVAALKQCPNYQVDRNHTNCGMRTRLMPILEYVTTMLGANAVPLSLAGWKKDQKGTSWAASGQKEDDDWQKSASSPFAGKKKEFVVPFNDNDEGSRGQRLKKGKVFLFTRSVASDQRLRHDGAMAADRIARELFTADDWDWTPEEDTSARISTTPFLGLK